LWRVFRGVNSILYFREIRGYWVDLRVLSARRQSWRATEVHVPLSANRCGNSTLKSSSFSVLATPFGGCPFLNISADLPIEGYPDSPGVGVKNPGETAGVLACSYRDDEPLVFPSQRSMEMGSAWIRAHLAA
jgi:hypothetical protein